MRCPKCSSNEFKPFETSEGVTLDFCGDCSAIWFDDGELALFVEAHVDIPYVQESLKAAKITKSECPVCQESHLVEMPYHPRENVLIDFCKNCRGVLLDAKEVPRIEEINVRRGLVRNFGSIMTELKKAGYVLLRK